MTKTISKILFIIALVTNGIDVFAAEGDIVNMFPPGNDGTKHGAGIIAGVDGSQYTFQTPQDNKGNTLELGDRVSFVIVQGNQATDVTGENVASYSGNKATISNTERTTKITIYDSFGNTVGVLELLEGEEALVTGNGDHNGSVTFSSKKTM